MIILGVNAYHPDSSAAIFKDNRIEYAIEEERLNRIKHWGGFPEKSIQKCLEFTNLNISDVDYVVFNSNKFSNLNAKIKYIAKNFTNLKFYLNKLKTYRINMSIKNHDIFKNFKGNFVNVDHHLSHVFSSYSNSGFDNALSISLDGFGDFASSYIVKFSNTKYDIIKKVLFPNSLGLFYQSITQFLGFDNYGDEYKVMGLASYGENKFSEEMDKLIRYDDNELYLLNKYYFSFHEKNISFKSFNNKPSFPILFNKDKFEKLFNLNIRKKNEKILQEHIDIAKSAQITYEKIILQILNKYQKITNCENLCISGGCAMNSSANGKILYNSKFKKIYIPSSPGDSGGAIGAIYYQLNKLGFANNHSLHNAYLGDFFSNDEILDEINKTKKIFTYKKYEKENLLLEVTNIIANGGVVGWFQGRSEWGPRALGSRSILADPRDKDIRETMNVKIKRREKFRPFAPSILYEKLDEWYEFDQESPNMSMVVKVKSHKKNLIPAVTHIDLTGRIQTVLRKDNEIYYDLIKKFEQKTSIPILLNTSFNENEPIVNSPKEAINTFLRTNMDALCIGLFILKRN